MACTPTIVQLNDELVALVDEEAHRSGLSQSAVIRDVLARQVEDRRLAALVEKYVDGYRRIPPGRPDEWGGLERAAEVSERERLQRLHREERDAGMDPW